jgi:hypothetical protein
VALIAAQRWPFTRITTNVASVFMSRAQAAPVCRPKLAVTRARLSEMRPPSMERRWTATITADASRCASKAGYFDLGILREKENSYPLEFREQVIWMEPSSLISVDLSADEAVDLAWIDTVQLCPCANENY